MVCVEVSFRASDYALPNLFWHVRLHYLNNEAPFSYYTVPERGLAVAYAYLPTLRPIFHGMLPE